MASEMGLKSSEVWKDVAPSGRHCIVGGTQEGRGPGIQATLTIMGWRRHSQRLELASFVYRFQATA